MKKKIIIGITPAESSGVVKMRTSYSQAILDAGAIPVILPHTSDKERMLEYAQMLDGLVFSGGDDVDPKYYNEEIKFDNVAVSPERDDFEFELFRIFYATKKPILGICRGEQLINVALGGKLHQHIDGHKQSEGREVFDRTAKLTPGSRLHEICDGASEIRTNSFHHQAVKESAPNVRISALADDMTVEAIEDTEHPFLVGVQWHPELFCRNDENARKLFEAFICAARNT